MQYLLMHTQMFFEDRIVNGYQIWKQYQSAMEVIITHPSAWSIREQSFLRMAVIDAGFLDCDKASTNVRFVTEAEASVHFCIHHTNLGSRLQVSIHKRILDLIADIYKMILTPAWNKFWGVRRWGLNCWHDFVFGHIYKPDP